MLATVAQARRFLGLTSTASDAVLADLIARVSSEVEQYCGRAFGTVQDVALRRLDGTGSPTLVFPGGVPVLSVSYLAIDGVEVTAAASSAVEGYLADDLGVTLTCGARFPFRRRCVQASWRAAELTTITRTIPATPHQIEPAVDGWAREVVSVTTAAGVLYTEVSGTPSAGQYSVSDGVLTFASANAGTSVTIVYAAVPFGVQSVAVEAATTMFKRRETLGVQSKSLAGESITYADMGDMLTDSLRARLGHWRNVVPA